MLIYFNFKLYSALSDKQTVIDLIPVEVSEQVKPLSFKECLMAFGDYVDEAGFKEEYSKLEIELSFKRTYFYIPVLKGNIKFQYTKDGIKEIK